MAGNQKELNPYLYPGRNCTAGNPAHVTESLSHYRTQRLSLVHSSSFSPLFPQRFYFWPVHCCCVNSLVRWKLSFCVKRPIQRASLWTRAGWVRLELWPTPGPLSLQPSHCPGSTSGRTELMAMSHHNLPVPLALSLLPKVPGTAQHPLTESSPGSCGHGGREKHLPCCPLPPSEGDSHKISESVFPLQTPCP